MEVRLSIHAQIRVMERGIDLDKIKKVISEPDHESQLDSGRIKSRKAIEGRDITVVYSKDKNTFVIITAI
jgi:hypothetical protein